MSKNDAQESGQSATVDWEKRATSAEDSLGKIAQGMRERKLVESEGDFDIADTALGLFDRHRDELTLANTGSDARDEEIAGLRRQLAAQKGATTKANAATATARAATMPRAVGAPPQPKRGQDPQPALTAPELLELIEEADEVEIVASDGKRAIADVPGFTIDAGGLVERRGQLVLEVPSLRVTGPNTGNAARTIAGFALLVDGEQVAWGELADPIALGAGQEYELKDSVVFGERETA